MEASGNGNVIKSDLGMRIITKYDVMPISNIQFNKRYQRDIEKKRLKKIQACISEHGYWPSEIIILNERYEIIDGQHRMIAAKLCGFDKIPITVITFPDKILEAKFFLLKNSFDTSLKSMDFFYSAYKAKDPYAILLYKLIWEDENSKLMFKCRLKNIDKKEAVFKIGSITYIINIIGLKYMVNFKKDQLKILHKKIDSIPYVDIRARINRFIDWFVACFEKDKNAYQHHTIRAIAWFYNALEKNNFLGQETHNYERSITKMKSFKFPDNFNTYNHLTRIMTLVNHFNIGKHNKLEYYK